MSSKKQSRFEIPISAVELWRAEINTHYSDMDAQGHINNLAYLEFMQECRVQWIANLDLESDYESVIVNIYIEYLQELVYPTSVTVIMTGSDPGRSSFMSHYEIRAQHDLDIIYSRGYAKIVWIDKNMRRSVPLPETVLEKLQQKS